MTTIKVTQEHIDNGKSLSPWSCPVALALVDATGKNWIVNGVTARLDWGQQPPVEHELPSKARNFILAFDLRQFVSPFTFKIDLSDHV